MTGIIILVVVVLVVLWGISAYNSLVRGNNKVEEAFSTMDVFLKKRYDLIPNMVETVKGYSKHEAETLERIVSLRAGAVHGTIDDKIEAEQQTSAALHGFMMNVEAYPDLKANVNFQELMKQLQDVETDIAKSRQYYNGCVRQFNDAVQTIPTNIIAGIAHFQKYRMFEAVNEERQNVKVKF